MNRCPLCHSSLTIVPEGRREQRARPWLSNRIPFVSCNGCPAIFDGIDWSGVGKGRRRLGRARVRHLLKPQVSKIVNALRMKANQIERLERGR